MHPNNPDAELEVISIEKKGKDKDKLLVRAETSPQSDRSALDREYFSALESLAALPPEAQVEVLRAIVARQDARESRLLTILEAGIGPPNISPQYHSYQNQGDVTQGDKKMTGDRTFNKISGDYYKDSQRIEQSSGIVANKVEGDVIQYGSSQKQDLAEAAAEIQKLLEQLEKTYPADTTTGRAMLGAKAIEEIENNPTLRQRAIGALKAGGVAAFEQVLNHPAASFIIAALQDWQSSKKD